jgi:hypothetical protein
MNKQQVIQTMQEDLSKMPELLKVCRAILNYICSQPEQNLRHITFGALSRAANLENMQDVIPASRYLVGARVPLLTPRFEFIEDDFIEDIPLKDVDQARDECVFYHPHKGEIVPDFESKLFMYFTISPQGKELRNG